MNSREPYKRKRDRAIETHTRERERGITSCMMRVCLNKSKQVLMVYWNMNTGCSPNYILMKLSSRESNRVVFVPPCIRGLFQGKF